MKATTEGYALPFISFRERWAYTASTQQTIDKQIKDAYERGKKAGQAESLNAIEKAIEDQFKKNLSQIAKKIEDCISYIESLEMHIHRTFIRPINIDVFQALITVSEADYLSDRFEGVYKRVFEIEEKLQEKELYLTFRFTEESETLNLKRIQQDGFSIERIGKE